MIAEINTLIHTFQVNILDKRYEQWKENKFETSKSEKNLSSKYISILKKTTHKSMPQFLLLLR